MEDLEREAQEKEALEYGNLDSPRWVYAIKSMTLSHNSQSGLSVEMLYNLGIGRMKFSVAYFLHHLLFFCLAHKSYTMEHLILHTEVLCKSSLKWKSLYWTLGLYVKLMSLTFVNL